MAGEEKWMGLKEVEVQTKIIKSIKSDGGYAFKMSNAYSAGIVDLFIALPPFVPCIVEVKDLKACVDGFDRQLEITVLQSRQLNQVSDVYVASGHYVTTNPRVSGVLVALFHRGENRMVGLPKDRRRLDASYEGDPRCWRKRGTKLPQCEGGYYEIAPMLEVMGINRLW
jgi:hypothetical protein